MKNHTHPNIHHINRLFMFDVIWCKSGVEAIIFLYKFGTKDNYQCKKGPLGVIPQSFQCNVLDRTKFSYNDFKRANHNIAIHVVCDLVWV